MQLIDRYVVDRLIKPEPVHELYGMYEQSEQASRQAEGSESAATNSAQVLEY